VARRALLNNLLMPKTAGIGVASEIMVRKVLDAVLATGAHPFSEQVLLQAF
jgi:hypothetical protein